MTTTARRDVFQAIADPTRRRIIGMLASGPLNLSAIAENFEISRPAISQQIRILEECGLVRIAQQGRERHCHASLDRLTEVQQWVINCKAYWNEKLDTLEDYLNTAK